MGEVGFVDVFVIVKAKAFHGCIVKVQYNERSWRGPFFYRVEALDWCWCWCAVSGKEKRIHDGQEN